MKPVDFDSIENYYFRLVKDYIQRELLDSILATTPGALEDVVCLALNQLPPRYIRFSADTTLYLSAEERQEMEGTVRKAVERAVEFVQKNPRIPHEAEDD